MTKVPVPWPWPFSKRRFFLLPKRMRITTDSALENHLIRPVIIILAVAVFIVNIGIPLATNWLVKSKVSHTLLCIRLHVDLEAASEKGWVLMVPVA
jgi:hypothetical protein